MRKIASILFGLLFLVLLLFIKHFYFPSGHKAVFPVYENWDSGNVNHIIPAANHNQILLKVSLTEAQDEAPRLALSDSLTVTGQALSGDKRFWKFFVDALHADTEYELSLSDYKGNPLSDHWPLKTYPHPDSLVEELTILSFTCAGGVPERVLNQEIFLKTEYKHELLKKGLSFNPDVAIANGDHIYWDQLTMDKSTIKKLLKLRLNSIYGELDLSQSMTSKHNFETIKRIADAQIAELYGCLLRSTPTYFLPDDHDLFENDEAHADLITLPPETYGIDGQATIQNLYYPEFLQDRNRSINLTGAYNEQNRNYGTLRYGKLMEALLYDCKRFTSLDGEDAVLVARDAEDWIIDRTTHSNANHLMHIPSTPVGLTAGKWSEWYPEVFQQDGQIGVGAIKKLEWQTGWWQQHQRLMSAWIDSDRIPIFLQGDLHISSYSEINKSGEIDFGTQPVHAIGTGTLGSGTFGFPSSFRGTAGVVPQALQSKQILKPLEKNGFSIIKVTPEKIKISMYAWRPVDGLETIENLEPILIREILRADKQL